MKKGTSFIFPLKIYIEDTDFGGIVYHANYLKFFERARSEWAEQSGFGIQWQQEHSIFLLVHSAKIDYLKPLRLNESVEVVTHIDKINKASLIYNQCLRSVQTKDTIFCKSEIKIACVGRDMKPQPLPFDLTLTGEQV